jgi:hypothetical protein
MTAKAAVLAAAVFGTVALGGLGGCSSPAPVEKKAEEPAEPLTGETAVFRMYQVARSTWARDVMVERMSSLHVNGVPDPPPGKANEWEAVFNSPSAGNSRLYTDSIVEQLPDLHKDVFAGPQQSPAGKPFPIAAVKVDTDAAYKTAAAKLDKADEKRIAGKPILILLETDRRFSSPVWRILWGESVGTAEVSVFVDVSTGEYLSTLH